MLDQQRSTFSTMAGRPRSAGVIPLLWLCGPPGVGKTVVGWEIYSGLVGSGVQAGYVDIDQLGMCYPESPSDPGRHRMKARNLAAVVAGYRAIGARCVVVSGVVDPRHGIPVDELPGPTLTVCRLRAADDELTRRYVGRSPRADDLPAVLREAADLDAGAVAGVCVDTSGFSVAEVARQVLDRTGWPVLVDRPGTAPEPAEDEAAEGTLSSSVDTSPPVLWLCGPTGVGKSTVGFQVYLRLMHRGLTVAYLDLDQIGFCGPHEAGHRVKAHNAGAAWRTFREAGAQALVAVGPVEDEPTVALYAEALSAGTPTVYRLHAAPEQLTERIMRRGRGGGSWPQPGDPLRGRSTAGLRQIADVAARDAAALDRAGIGRRVDTGGRDVDELADLIVGDWNLRGPRPHPSTSGGNG
jgi:adenylylsulfate kinase-like enzyme